MKGGRIDEKYIREDLFGGGVVFLVFELWVFYIVFDSGEEFYVYLLD